MRHMKRKVTDGEKTFQNTYGMKTPNIQNAKTQQ